MVSVITPAYNCKNYIERCIKSVLAQKFLLEHIIVDDCSSDGTTKLLQSFERKYPSLRVIYLNTNNGPFLCRNYGIKISKGKFIAFLDADDYWLPEKLNIQVGYMLVNNYDFTFTDYRYISENGNFVGNRLFGIKKINWHLHHMSRFIGCSTVVFSKHLIDNINFSFLNREIKADDFYLWSLFISSGSFPVRCPYDLVRYTKLPNSRSSDGFSAMISVFKLYTYVEKIPPMRALFYLFLYTFFVVLKRIYLNPRIRSNYFEPTVSMNYQIDITYE